MAREHDPRKGIDTTNNCWVKPVAAVVWALLAWLIASAGISFAQLDWVNALAWPEGRAAVFLVSVLGWLLLATGDD